MKSLEEKKMLVKMARMLGQPVDQALIESIEREEKLTAALFKEEKKPTIVGYEEGTTFLNRVPILKEDLLTEADPMPAPKPAETNLQPPEDYKVQQVANYLDTVSNTKKPPLTQALMDKEFEALRKTVMDLLSKVNTLSWGGGGTGVVRFIDLDDHFHPQDVRVLQFNDEGTGLTPTLPGSIGWNPTEDCLNVYQEDGSTLQVGLEQYIRVKNNSGTTLNNATLVQFAGVNGGFDPVVTPLIANTTFDPLYTVGVLTGSIANGEAGRATTFGKVRNIDTTGPHGEAWQIGDLLWADPAHPGSLTNVKPTAPNVAISIAAVTRVDATEGEILVRPTIEPRKYYGSFSDIQNQTAPASNTATPMKFDTVEFASGFRIINYQAGTNNAIQALNTGLYNFQFSSQFTSSNSSRSRIWIWIRKNGQDVKDTATVVAIESNGGVIAPAWNFIVSMQANDVFQLMWATDAFDKVSMLYQANTAFCPAIPSVLLSVSQIAE